MNKKAFDSRRTSIKTTRSKTNEEEEGGGEKQKQRQTLSQIQTI